MATSVRLVVSTSSMPRLASARVSRPLGNGRQRSFDIGRCEKVCGRVANAVLHECLRRHEVEVAGEKVVRTRVGRAESGAAVWPAAPTAIVRVWLSLIRSTRSIPQGSPQCRPGSHGSGRTAPNRRTIPDLVGLQGRHSGSQVAAHGEHEARRPTIARRLMASVPP